MRQACFFGRLAVFSGQRETDAFPATQFPSIAFFP
jgi:hypothetical protein